MEINLTEIRAEARQALRGRRPSVFLVSLAYCLVVLLLAFLSQRLVVTAMHFPEIMALSEQMVNAETEAEQTRILESVLALADTRELIGEYLVAAIEIMTMMLFFGFLGYCLGLLRGDDGSVGALFDAFGNFFRFLGMGMLTRLIVWAWSLLLIVPGIVAAYRYALAPFFLVDDPRRGPVQCMRESKEWMRGNKRKLFLLDLSMLGWVIGCLIPGVSIYALPYVCTAHANFYRALTGRREPPTHVDVSV